MSKYSCVVEESVRVLGLRCPVCQDNGDWNVMLVSNGGDGIVDEHGQGVTLLFSCDKGHAICIVLRIDMMRVATRI